MAHYTVRQGQRFGEKRFNLIQSYALLSRLIRFYINTDPRV